VNVFLGCAGWSIPREHAGHFPAAASHLERYSQRFGAVEINSSFYRQHRPATYAHWAASVPEGFRFAVKVPREITHVRRLADTAQVLDRFLGEAGGLGDKLGPLLVQLPPSLALHASVARRFFTTLRQHFAGALACEPRHASWFTPAADQLLAGFHVAQVAADPAVVAAAALPGAWDGLRYYRLHGTPRMYYSAYSSAYLDQLAGRLTQEAGAAPDWCIFDNTALGAATANALELQDRLRAAAGPPGRGEAAQGSPLGPRAP
jgi:uncharacterized protein YecE (DUF72 family)